MPRTKSSSAKRGVGVRSISESVGNVREEEANEIEQEDNVGVDDDAVEEEEDLFSDDNEAFGEEDVDEHIPVDDNANEDLENQVGDDEDGDGDSDDELWREDVIPEPIFDEEAEAEGDVSNGGHSENEDEGEDAILKLGKCFSSGREFKHALLRYSLVTRYDIKLNISSEKKLCAVCSDKDNGCPWRVYCSYERRKRKLQIKVLEEKHICIRSGYSRMLKCSTIGELFEDKLRLDPGFKAVDMAAEIKRRYNLIVTDEQCRKAKSKLAKQRSKSHEEQFARIWDYEAELHKTNEGTIVDIETFPGATPGSLQRFDRIYICFEAQRTAWRKYCRPIIGLDGAFLKWDIKGQLLAAVGRDGDNRIVPIAWALVEVENDINWDWFLAHLKKDLALGEGSGFVMISDKQKGLVNSIKNQLSEAEHRQYARHILGNWKRDNSDMQLERLFWKIARSYTIEELTFNMEAMRLHNNAAYESLLKTKPHTWSRAYLKVGANCNDVLNNLCESFNKTIREARKKPVLELLEDVRRQCMVRTAKRGLITRRLQTKFTKSAHKQIEISIQKSRDCVRYMSTRDLHEVNVLGTSYRVDMAGKNCGCGKWQLNGIPCEHAASVIIGSKLNMEDYVEDCFLTEIWQKTYERGIQPVQGMKLWPRVGRLPVLPPPHRERKVGRPSKHARRKSAGESTSTSSKTRLTRAKRVMSCSNCKEEGHSKISCKKEAVQPAAKRPRGRPKKTTIGSQGGSQVGGSQVGGSQVG